MSKQPLPVVDAARTEFGFPRTECGCDECARPCHYMPGYLVPADLERIHQLLAPEQDLREWATDHLLASPGAVVMRDGQEFRIPTLVPARRGDGACRFLAADSRCAIYAVSPFGCAFIDSHMTGIAADHRSIRGLLAILDAWNHGTMYSQIWLGLAAVGLVALAPEIARQQLRRSHQPQ